jgi:2',3'-cyclic-nucleotide 2'-phosphodiesterase (5'-nucleotidase family)
MNIARLASLLLFTAATPAFAAESGGAILYSGDVLGEVEPCGCRVNPAGGVVRRSGLLARLTKEKKGPFLQVDAGDFLFEGKDLPESLAERSKIQAQALVRAHERMGLDVFVPGEKDLALGLPMLRNLFEKSKTKILTANLRWEGKPVFPGSAIFELKTGAGKVVRIGVVGLVGETVGYPSPLTVEPRLAAFEREKAALDGKVDQIVIVSHSGMEADLELAKKTKGVALIVGAHTQSFTQEPVVENGIPIVQASYRGQHVGFIPLETLGKPESFSLYEMDDSYEKEASSEIRKITERLKKDIAGSEKKLLKKPSR